MTISKENYPRDWNGYKNYIISGLSVLVLTLLGVIGFMLSGYQHSLIQNQKDLMEKLDKIAAEAKQERSGIRGEIAKICERIGKHEVLLDRHDWLLKLPFPTRDKLYEGNKRKEEH